MQSPESRERMPDPYVSEVKYLGGPGLDFIEIAVDEGTDVSSLVVTVYNSNGTIRSENALGSLVTNQFGKDVYIIDTATSGTFNGLNKFGAVALSDGTDLFQFISFNDGSTVTATEGDADGIESDQIGLAGSGESLETTDGGATYTTQTGPNSGTIPCFLRGTLIETTNGPIRVEDMTPGQVVITANGQTRRVEMCLRRQAIAIAGDASERFFPIKIVKNALGPGVPSTDLYVSRQHRVLISSKIARRMFGTDEVLVAAVRLLDLADVSVAYDCALPVYYHLVLESHDVVLANGAPCESFLLAPQSLQSVDRLSQKRIYARFPQAKAEGFCEESAYFIPPGPRQRNLIGRQIKNGQQLIQ